MKNNYLLALVLGAIISTNIFSSESHFTETPIIHPNFDVKRFAKVADEVNSTVKEELEVIKRLRGYEMELYPVSKLHIYDQLKRITSISDRVVREGSGPYPFKIINGKATYIKHYLYPE